MEHQAIIEEATALFEAGYFETLYEAIIWVHGVVEACE